MYSTYNVLHSTIIMHSKFDSVPLVQDSYGVAKCLYIQEHGVTTFTMCVHFNGRQLSAPITPHWKELRS